MNERIVVAICEGCGNMKAVRPNGAVYNTNAGPCPVCHEPMYVAGIARIETGVSPFYDMDTGYRIPDVV